MNFKNIIFIIGKIFHQIVLQKMTFYKEKIQKQLRKTLQTFRNNQTRSIKTHLIQKQSKKRRVFRPQYTYYQQNTYTHNQDNLPVINFFNILTVNQKAAVEHDQCESYIQTNFYFKNIRKIEVKQNYIVLFLNDSGLFQQPIDEALIKLRNSPHEKLRLAGQKLQELSKKLELNTLNQETGICLTAQAYQMLDSLGSSPFICKIFSEKLVISKSLLDLKQFQSEEFIIESLKYKFPLMEMFTSKNYFNLLMKQIQFYSGLMDVLQGRIPFASFLQTAQLNFTDSVHSKSNIQYSCQMSFSMPIPLVELIKIQSIIQTKQNFLESTKQIISDKFKQYQNKIRTKQHKTLQHLLALANNYLPQNYMKVASYQEIRKQGKLEEEERKSETDFDKNSLTLSNN